MDQWADLFTHFKCFSLANTGRNFDFNMKEGSERISYHDETRVVSWNSEASSVSRQLNRIATLQKKLPIELSDKSRKKTAVDRSKGHC